jgi:ppGpp synthetase/RelA/SpoT-type nucleotidyltranferase
MEHDRKSSLVDKKQFLLNYNFTIEDLDNSKLEWSLLEQVHTRHVSMIGELQTTANYISQRLQALPAVHSLNVRIKHPEHLIAKMIRKKIQHPELVFDVASYEGLITDLIGIRALHLFKDEWRTIHEFITATWELHEQPIAYIRAGDPAPLLDSLAAANFRVEAHPFGYRSIHYVIKSQPAKCVQLAELQIRTIFEEGWSEIDHRVRYPRQSDDPYLAEFLTIFNRLAGSADEMGTFIKSLSRYISGQAIKLAEREVELARKEEDLKTAISKLQISESEKKELQHQIDELRKSSWIPLDLTGAAASLSGDWLKGLDLSKLAVTTVVPDAWKAIDFSPMTNVISVGSQVCPKCGGSYFPNALLGTTCPTCGG